MPSPNPSPPLVDAAAGTPSLRTLGTSATQAAAGNDSRFASATGALQIANNLSDLASASTARTNLGLAAVAASGSASDLSTGTLPAGRLPALTGDVTSSSGSAATTLANIPTHIPVAGDLIVTAITAPSTPASGKGAVYVDSTSKALAVKTDAGIVSHTVQTKAAVASNFLTAILADGTVSAAQPAASDITGLAAVATSGSASDLSTGTLPAGRLPALSGDITSSAGSASTTLANIPTGVPVAGFLLATSIAAPSTPAAGNGSIYVDSTSKNLAVKDDAGVVKHGVQTKAAVTSNFLISISDAGVVTAAQPASTDISGLGTLATQSGTFSGTSSGTNTGDQTITLTGGVTGSGTGSFAATVITNANLTGDVTSSGNAATLANIPTHVPVAGDLIATAIAAPSTPAAGKGAIYVDSTSKNLAVKDDAGVVKHGVRTLAVVGGQFVTGIDDDGTVHTDTTSGGGISALTGDVTASGSGSVTATLANIPTAVPMAGTILATAIAAPSTPASGKGAIYVDSTSKNLAVKDDAGVVKHGVQTNTGAASNFLTAISDAGVVSRAQPAASDITGLAAVATSGSASDLSTGTLPAGRLPALTGDVTTSAGSAATTLANIPTGVPMAGTIIATAIAAPATPAANKGAIFFDSTEKQLWVKDEFGTLSHMVHSKAAIASNFLTAVFDSGTVSSAQPAFADISGVASTAQLPALTGDVTKASGTANTVLANIPTAVPMAGTILATAIAAPSTPAAGKGAIYVDSTAKNLAVKDDAGVVKHGVQTNTGAASNFLTAISDAGVVSRAQPAFADISGTLAITAGGTGQITAILAKDAITTKSADIASATTTDLSTATGEYAVITGTTTITGFGTVAAGALRVLKFSGILILTYNATSMILPGGGGVTTAAGDVAEFRSLGSGNWICTHYTRAAAAAGSLLSGELDVDPAAFTVIDWNPTGLTTATFVRINNSFGTLNITGIAGGFGGRILYIHNNHATSTITILEEFTSSAAINRFKTGANGSGLIRPGATAAFFYSATDARWEAYSFPYSIAGTYPEVQFSGFSGQGYSPVSDGYQAINFDYNILGNGVDGGLSLKHLATGGRMMEHKGADVASANNLVLGTDGNSFHITGTTTIKEISSTSWKTGSRVYLIFDSVCTVQDGFGDGGGDTPSFSIRTKSASDLEMAVNSTLELVFDGAHWYEI